MENYVKGEVKELDIEPVFGDILVEDAVRMKVNSGSKIRNLIGYVAKKMQDPKTRQMTWSGSGWGAVTKVVTCTEITKRKFKNLHQVNDIRYKRFEEYWDPTVKDLERLRVNRDIPLMTVLLSKDPLDPNLLGYQGPGKTGFLPSSTQQPGTSKPNDSNSLSQSNRSGTTTLKRKRKPKKKSTESKSAVD